MNRWVLAALAVALAIVLVATGMAAGPPIGTTIGLELGGLGVGLLVLGLWRWPAALVVGLVLVAVPWGVALAEEASGIEAVALGAALLTLGEIAGWSLDRATVVPERAPITSRMAVRTAGMVGAGALLSALLLAVSTLPAPGSLLRLVAGLGAALAVLAFVTLRRWDASGRDADGSSSG